MAKKPETGFIHLIIPASAPLRMTEVFPVSVAGMKDTASDGPAESEGRTILCTDAEKAPSPNKS